MRKFLTLGIAVSIVTIHAAVAQVVVVKPGNVKTTIQLSGIADRGGEAGKRFLQTLEQDLVRSGWFVVSPQGATIVVTGSCAAKGNTFSVRCVVKHAARSGEYLSDTWRRDVRDVEIVAHNVADAIVEAVKGVKGIASTRIVMIGSHRRGKDLFTCGADGGGLVQLTRSGAVCLSPGWYPDAESIVYTSFHGGFPDVYSIDLDRNTRKKIAGYPGLNAGADVSPDGRHLALTLSRDGNPELYVLSPRNGRTTRLSRTRHAAEASPSWSPDGRHIVYVSDKSGSPQLYVVGADGGSEKRITFRGSENVAPDWGPDGRIAYSSRRNRRYHICVYDPKRGETEQVTSSAGTDHEDPSWAPDGRHIVYAKTRNYQSDLYVLDTLGDPEVRLTTLGGDWYSPSWSPK